MNAGFTLLEVAFVITIFAIMASIVLFRFRDFGSRTALDNLTQDIALRIVQAQKQSISGVLNANVSDLSLFVPTYGVYFTNGSTGGAPESRKFVYFTDLDETRTYDPATVCTSTSMTGNECLATTTITTGEYISTVCTGSALFPCTGTPSSNLSAHITFQRPLPDATIYICRDTACTSRTLTDRLYIELTSSIDPALKETIEVTGLGQTSVYNGCAAMAAGATTCS